LSTVRKCAHSAVFRPRSCGANAMATQSSALAFDIVAFSARLFNSRELSPRSRIIAQTIADLLPDSAVTVYLLATTAEGRTWKCQGAVGDISAVDSSIPETQGTLGILAHKAEPLVFSGHELLREHFSHLHVRRTLKSLAYLPLKNEEVISGALEILGFDSPLDEAALASLEPISEIGGRALTSAVAYEEERNNALASITRVTQLYDLEKVFSSTLELDELLPIIGSKFREILDCQAVNVWLLQRNESLVLMHQSGLDPTTPEGTAQKPGEGIAGDVSDSGDSVLIESLDDERLIKRNGEVEEGAIFSLVAAPLIDRGALAGVVEAINRMDGLPFDEDQLFALTTLAETAVNALHNASLLMAERKVEILEALVKTSGEITSTLDLDRVLQAVVNGPAAVIPYERAAIALEQRGRFELKAVSGTTEVDLDDPRYRSLQEILRWAAILNEPLVVTQHGEEIDSDREETRAKFRSYFAGTGMQACHLVPLVDEEGRVGVLLFESSDPDFLSDAHLEMIQVLASQATVALRNASLYKEVPFIGVLQPLVEHKNRFLALEKHKRTALVGSAVAAAIFLLAFPLPLRVVGDAVVAPARVSHVGSEFEGVIKDVSVREGDRVSKGEAIATLEDWEYRAALAAAEAKYQTATAQMDRALASSDGGEAGIQRAQADYWASEVTRAQDRLTHTVIRSPISGIIATRDVEDLAGHKVKAGESFVDIIDASEAQVDVAIDDDDIALLKSGEKSSIKLDGFPERTFHGRVAVISPQAVLQNAEPMFYARVRVPNPDNSLRSGMQGRGKITTGWRPAGVVMFRRLGIWVWTKLWSWFGW
jgi:RND family efflux transporter MFP subunit